MTWILKAIGGMKGWLLVAGGSIFAALLAWTKIQGRKIDRLEDEVESKDATIKHRKKVEVKQAEHQMDFDVRVEELAKEIEETKVSSELSKPNEW